MGNIVGGSNIGINLAELQNILGILYRDIIQPFYGLESSGFINYIQDRASINIYNINKYRVVKIRILVFLQHKLKPSGGFTVFLVVEVVPSEVVNDLLINIIIARAFQYLIQPICRQIFKAAVELVEFYNSQVVRVLIK